jgi:hypothetical protein
MHGKGERKASKGLLLASCMDDAMVELGSSSAQPRARRKVKRRPQEEWKEQRDTYGLLTSSYDDGRAWLVRTAIYGIHETSETRAGKRVVS